MAGSYHYGIVALVAVALLFPTTQCNMGCKGTDGAPGAPGRDGWPGVKGEKGEPAVGASVSSNSDVLLTLKGERGRQGTQGVTGPKGLPGKLGAIGRSGNPGSPGPEGSSFGTGPVPNQQTRSAFSALRTDSSYPRENQYVTFDKFVVDQGGEFSLTTGEFTCRVDGVYYFTFQSIAKVSMCLRIAGDPLRQSPLGFCDKRRGDQVLSGGVVLQLAAGNKVWLESFRDHQSDSDIRDTQEKKIIFNGFMLFSGSQ